MSSIANTKMDTTMAYKTLEAPDQERLLSRAEAARYLSENWRIPTSVALLAKLAVNGGGPEYRKAGRTPLYPQDGLDTYAKAKLTRRVRCTAELREANSS
jgi:hypothetical protein